MSRYGTVTGADSKVTKRYYEYTLISMVRTILRQHRLYGLPVFWLRAFPCSDICGRHPCMDDTACKGMV